MPDDQRDPAPAGPRSVQRHRLELRCPTGNPDQATIHLDGEQLLFVTRIELVLDGATREATARLTIPAAYLDLDVDVAAFVTAHTEPEQARAAAPMATADDDLPLAEQAWAAVQARHREANGA